ncbi:hypothetical protein TNCT_613501 [Trichonephila clavata]|uniref:Reverse transcriptase n=1 Tax=Trichonephila clavata TaxID=2740835 RepID=A0A8X6KVB1_TRICU|nr:hypothetical protein TNCT_613501 [Trichonephila clavata]
MLLFLESKGVVSDYQAGLQSHRSPMDKVMKLTQAVNDGFQLKQSTLAVLVDFIAANDNVWHHMLLHKLKKHRIAGKLLNWV